VINVIRPVGEDAGGILAFFGLFVMLAIYFIPSFVAALRRHRNFIPILLLNIFLGFTFLGWVAAFIWASLIQQKKQG